MNNLPAFPQSLINYDGSIRGGCDIASTYEGLSLRDYFAAKAMQGILCSPKPFNNTGEITESMVANYSYAIAHAMCLEKEKWDKVK